MYVCCWVSGCESEREELNIIQPNSKNLPNKHINHILFSSYTLYHDLLWTHIAYCFICLLTLPSFKQKANAHLRINDSVKISKDEKVLLGFRGFLVWYALHKTK